MEQIDIYDADITKFEWETIWIKKCKGQRKGEDPTRYKATTKEEVKLIGDELKNFITEELNLFSNQYIKPIFDRDSYKEIKTWEDTEMIKHIFPNAKVKVATRKPREKHGKMFWSARYIVQDICIRPNQLLDLIKNEEKVPDDYFDLSKYGKGGQFFTLYNDTKYDGEVPPLLPHFDRDPNPLNYYATYVKKEWANCDERWEKLQMKLGKEKEKEVPIEYKDNEEVDMGKSNEIEDVISRLTNKRADDYDSWLKVVIAEINYGLRLGLDKRCIKKLIHKFSEKSDLRYEEDRVDEWITNNYDRIANSDVLNKLSRNYLINVCLKTDDPKYWAEKYKYRDYKLVLKLFNEECIRVLGNTRWIKMCEVDDVNLVPYILMNKEGLTHRYSIDGKYFYIKRDVGKDGKEKREELSIVDAKSPFWKDPNVKRYDNIIYAPLRPIDDKYYNTWTGWKASTYKECKDYTKCEIFINHLKGAWCKNDEKLCKWFLEYFSGILRGARTCVCPVVRGKQGSGKDCFISELFMNRIMGKEYCITTNNPVAHIFGKFNGALLNKSFVVIEEGSYDLEKEYSQLKSIITNDMLTIEEKFMNVVNAKNYCNPIVSTNKHDILKGDKGMKQRRLIYIECDPVKRSDEYYENYFKALEDEEALSAFYNYLLDKDMVYQYNIADLAYLQKTMPETKIGLDITYRNMPQTTKFLKDYFKIEELDDWIKNYPQKDMKVSGKDIQKSYKNYCEYAGLEKVNVEHFTTNLLNNNDVEYKRFANGMCYVIPFATIVSIYNLLKKDIEDGKQFEDDAVLYSKIKYDFSED